MAKFCGTCGGALEEGTKFCDKCGAPVEADAGVTNDFNNSTVPTGSSVAPAANGSNKAVKLIIAGIVAIVVIVVAVNIIGRFTGYNGALRKMTNALADYDMETLTDLSSDVSNEMYENIGGDDYEEYYDELVSDTLDRYEDEVGAVKSIKYEVTDAKEVSERRLDDMKDDWVDAYHLDVDKIKKIVTVDLSLKVKGKDDTAIFTVSNLHMVKEDGKWKILYGYND